MYQNAQQGDAAFEASLASLAEYTGDTLKHFGVVRVEAFATQDSREVDLYLTLRRDTFDARSDVAWRMGEIQDMFQDDFSIDFFFGEAVPRPSAATASRDLQPA